VRVLLPAVLLAAACGAPPDHARSIAPRYDQTTGRLKELRYDSNGDGAVDTVSFMDGSRVLRVEIDKDQDGKVERWEHYGDGQQLVRVGFSPANDGRETAWSFAGADGRVARIEFAGGPDPAAITRIEHYQQDVISRGEEDTNRDGRMDKWERYERGRLSSLAFDGVGRGTPDRKLTYRDDGSALVEVDPDGDGRFEAASVR
jgi:hypothetical protein